MAASVPSAAPSSLRGSCIAASAQTKRVVFVTRAVVWLHLLSRAGCADASSSSRKGCVAASVPSPTQMLSNTSSSVLTRLCALCGRVVVVIMWGAACIEPVARATSHIRAAFASIGKWRWLKTLKQREAGERTCGHTKGCDAAFACVCVLQEVVRVRQKRREGDRTLFPAHGLRPHAVLAQTVAASSSLATCILLVCVVIVAARGLYGCVCVTV